MAKTVSVVIASGAGGDHLFRCLDSLHGQAVESGCEVIVVDRVGGETRARLARDYPWVSGLEAEGERASIPELRRQGAVGAQGEVVAVLEEHGLVSPGWLDAVRTGFQQGDVAIGGPVRDDDFRRLGDWAVYFSEYNNALPPWVDGPSDGLNGANIAYDRAALIRHERVLGEGFWEVVLHPHLATEGTFRAVSGMRYHKTGPFDFGAYLVQRYHLSRFWGGAQREVASLLRRVVYVLLSPVLPLLLLTRIGLRVARSDRSRAWFLASVPLLVPVCIVYVWGEALGLLLGPGDSLERIA